VRVTGPSGGDGSRAWGLRSSRVQTWRRTIWVSKQIMTLSFLSLLHRLLVARTIAHKSHQVHERLGSEQNTTCLVRCVSGERNGFGEVGPAPREGVQQAALTAHKHPRNMLAPEDVADASRLPGDTTLLGQNGGLGSLKCNIRCYLFGG
jgi:hypothetical protein